MNKYLLTVLSLVFLSFFSCTQETVSENGDEDTLSVAPEKEGIIKEEEFSLEYDHRYDAISALIAGMKPEQSSLVSYKDTLAVWTYYNALSDSLWNKVENDRFVKMKKWRDEELSGVNVNNREVFYPFSGPDILNAFIFFPNAKTYTLIALEPVGDLPDLHKMNEAMVESYLSSVEKSLADIFKRSYFITKNMLTDLQKSNVNGTLPVMCVFLKRTGNTIVNIEHIVVDSAGVVNVKSDSTNIKGTKGVKIDFLPAGGKSLRTVYYFKTDLSDPGLKTNQGFVKYLESKGTVHTYLKSASYLLHYGGFSTIRNYALNNSDCILQDDSGIAFKFFDDSQWDLQLYGKYAKPIAEFANIKEDDLKKAFEDSTVKELPFSLGYRWGTKDVNMLRAIRK